MSCLDGHGKETDNDGKRARDRRQRGAGLETSPGYTSMSKEANGAKRERMILAGKLMIGEGISFFRALTRVGYSKFTARTPAQHGLYAKECVRLALQEDHETEPATLRESARKLFNRRLEVALEDPAKESLTSVSRALETCERSYGGAQDPRRSETLATRCPDCTYS